MNKLLCIALGGAAGSAGRHAAIEGVKSFAGESWPLGTLLVNVLGCFCLGALAGLFVRFPHVREPIRLGLTAGVLGGFTTFSTFALEAFYLVQRGQAGAALLYVLLSCSLGVAAAAGGFRASCWK